MMELGDLLACVPTTPAPAESEDELEIELVFRSPLEIDTVRRAVIAATPDNPVRVWSAFDGGSDRYFFVTYLEKRLTGHEPSAFEFARAFREALGADEANLVHRDSLYGSVAVIVPEALSQEIPFSLSGLCDSGDNWSYAKGWAHEPIATRGAWTMSKGGGVRIGHIDTGYTDHQELAGIYDLSGQANYVERGADARDRLSTNVIWPNPGHGSLVGSVMASRGGLTTRFDTLGPGVVTGVAPEAMVVPIRALRSVIDLRQSRLPAAIAHASDGGCDVIVLCLGGPGRIASVEQALRDVVHAGRVVVCAAGNCWPFVAFPAAYSRERLSVAVAALTYDLKPWSFTARGGAVTVSAPGEDVWGATILGPSGDIYPSVTAVSPCQGTTLAAALTAGIAALWVSYHGGGEVVRKLAEEANVTVQELFMRAVVHDIAPPPVWAGATDLGAGVVNAERTLAAPLATRTAMKFERPPSRRAVSTLQILRQHAEHMNEAARCEIDDDLRHFAAEILWLSYQQGARQRVHTVLRGRSDAPAAIRQAPGPSPGLDAQLVNRPNLRAALTS